jgi:signal peptidase
MKPSRLIQLAAMCVVVASVGLLLLVGVGPRTGRYRTLTMLTGSMSPRIPPGSLVVVVPQRTDRVRAGDVIVFNAPDDGRVVTHRVVEVVDDGGSVVLRTKGDANMAADRERVHINSKITWRVRAVVPRMGTGVRLVREPLVRRVTTLGLPVVLLALWLRAVWCDAAKRAV